MQYSIVNLSEILKINLAFRLDAEFYKKEYLENDKLLLKTNTENVNDYSFITDGEHGSPDWDNSTNIKYITAENIKPGYIFRNDFKTISKEQHKRNDRSRVRENDILLYSVGGRGYVAKAEVDLFPCNIPRSVAIIRLNDYKKFNSEYITTFLNSRYGEYQVQRLQAGNIQPMLSLENIKKFQVVELTLNFQEKIANLYNTSYALRQSADTLYKEAEEILLEELGLKNYQPQNKKCFVKMLSDTQEAGRIDAEYFQPKYEDIIDKIKKYKNGFLLLEDKDINDKNFNPKKDIEYKYIELANISGNSSIDGVENIIGCDLPTRARRIVKADDLIVSSIEGSLNSIALISKELDGALCSTGFFIINSNKINSEALLVLLKSNLGQMQLKRGCKGTILTAISKDELKNIIVPLLPQSIQSKISAKIQQSFESREESKQLLEVAKRAVEIAIEENEEAGLKYIEENK